MATAKVFLIKKIKLTIGDGSMTGGMVYEAMNNIGLLKKDIIVVLNDNKMSIAPMSGHCRIISTNWMTK